MLRSVFIIIINIRICVRILNYDHDLLSNIIVMWDLGANPAIMSFRLKSTGIVAQLEQFIAKYSARFLLDDE